MEPRDQPVTERIAGDQERHRAAGLVLSVMLIAVSTAIIKPWDFGAERAVATPRPASAATPRPTRAPPPSIDRLAAVCLRPFGWRIVATERWRDRTVRSWKAIEPVEATGPDDPSIPTVIVAGDSVPALGWCSPVDGLEQPPTDARATVFAVDASGVARRVTVRQLAPSDVSSGGATWAPPGPGALGAVASETWPVGRYVIRVATPDGSYERWLGADVLRPARERSLPSPAVSPGH